MNAILFDETQVGEGLGVSVGTLRNWRCSRLAGPAFVKVGRLVRYRQADVDAWLASRVVTPADPASRFSCGLRVG